MWHVSDTFWLLDEGAPNLVFASAFMKIALMLNLIDCFLSVKVSEIRKKDGQACPLSSAQISFDSKYFQPVFVSTVESRFKKDFGSDQNLS